VENGTQVTGDNGGFDGLGGGSSALLVSLPWCLYLGDIRLAKIIDELNKLP